MADPYKPAFSGLSDDPAIYRPAPMSPALAAVKMCSDCRHWGQDPRPGVFTHICKLDPNVSLGAARRSCRGDRYVERPAPSYLAPTEPAPLTPAEALALLLDQVDYTAGACKLTEMVGAVLDASVIETCRRVLDAANSETDE